MTSGPGRPLRETKPRMSRKASWAPRRRLVAAAVRAVDAWVRLYSAPLPEAVRAQRRAELAADLHDHLADLGARRLPPVKAALEVLRRGALGVPADLAWMACMSGSEIVMRAAHRMGALAISGWACAVLLSVLDLLGALAGLRDGWRELPEHWWSVLAVAGVVVSISGLIAALAFNVHQARDGQQSA